MKIKKIGRLLGIALLVGVGLWALPAGAQQILLDKPVRAGDLTVFPDLNDENVYYYISDKPRLATDANGRPQFSFLRYVEVVRPGAEQPAPREGEGGGIVHAVVNLGVTREQLQEAQRQLQRLKPGARIQGPVVYRSGKFGLVSSFQETDGTLTTKVVGLGNAPLLDGEKAAVSIRLTKLGAKLLWESFQTPTPDISFTFEMEVGGFRSPHRAVIEANFDQIYEHQAFAAGLASTYLAAEIKGAFDDLTRQGAIKLTEVGADEQLQPLITTAYNKIADMMFSPLNGTGTPSLESLAGTAGGGTSMLDRASTLLQHGRDEARAERERAESREDAARSATATPAETTAPAGAATPAAGEGEARAPAFVRAAGLRPGAAAEHTGRGGAGAQGGTGPSFAVVAAFEMKRVRQRGIFRIDLNKYTTDNLTLRFDENIGDLRSLMGDEGHFRAVNLDDPLYRQREIAVILDGFNAGDFAKYINFVTVHLRKRHAGGDETHEEVRITRDRFNAEANNFRLFYGWKNDTDRARWMEYEYQIVWSFFGGRTVEEPWKRWAADAIPVSPPYHRRRVDLDGRQDTLTAAGVRSVTVKVFYDLGGAAQSQQVTLNVDKNQVSDSIEFMLPANQFDYNYEINWRLRGNRTLSSGRQTSNETTLFIDELP